MSIFLMQNCLSQLPSHKLFSRWLISILFVVCCQCVWSMEAPRYQLVLQVSEASLDKLNLALNSALGVQDAFGPDNVDVEIVIYGAGVQTVKYYLASPLAEKVKQATYRGIRIVVCEQSLRAARYRTTDLLPEVKYVPFGVAEIIEKQSQGWAYVRP